MFACVSVGCTYRNIDVEHVPGDARFTLVSPSLSKWTALFTDESFLAQDVDLRPNPKSAVVSNE